MKRFPFLSLSLLALLILIPGCFTLTPTPYPAGTTPVIMVFSNFPSSINPGDSTTLLWNVTGATSVSIDQGIGQVDVAGTRVISPAQSTVYTISATNSAGTVTRTVTTTVSSALPPPAMPFAVTSVVANSTPATFSGSCPKTFTFYATITVNGPGTVTYRWERSDGGYSDVQSLTFSQAGAKIATFQWDLGQTASGWHRIHILTPYDAASNPVYYTLNCNSGSLVTGIIVGIDEFPFTGPCPKAIHFWGTIAANGPGAVTYRWERSDGSALPVGTINFTSASSQTVTDLWTRSDGSGWESLHVLTPNDVSSSQIAFTVTCYNQTPQY